MVASSIKILEERMLKSNIIGPNYVYVKIKGKIKKIFCSQLNFLAKYFFGSNFIPNISLNVMQSLDGVEHKAFKLTSLWDDDRFVPCLNALYFPFGFNSMPFERLITSPLIKNDSCAKKLQSHYLDIRDFIKNYKIFKSLCEKNTLFIGFHHILHRRSIINSPGKRITIFIDWYDSFTRFSLLKSYFKNKILKKLKFKK